MDDINTVVSPDISILADVSKLDASGYVGVPSLSIEILSISSYLYDLRIKYSLYERVGVSEYWIVFPVDGAIHIFTLDASGKYGDGIVYERGSVPIGILGGELLELSDIFKR
jgi:Uma2 family endonuclease